MDKMQPGDPNQRKADVATTFRAPKLRDRFGLCQWFHYEAYEDVVTAVEAMKGEKKPAYEWLKVYVQSAE